MAETSGVTHDSHEGAHERGAGFDRCNLDRLELTPTRAHGGDGLIGFARVVERRDIVGACNFIDVAQLPPGASIGRHTHGASEEEFYLVVSGSGEMYRNGERFPVEEGDLIRNPPNGTHSLRNTGSRPLRIFVFELEVVR